MTDRAQGHLVEEEWEHQPVILEETVIVEEQPARLHQSPTAVFVAMVIHEELLGLVYTLREHRVTVYGQFLGTIVKAADLGK